MERRGALDGRTVWRTAYVQGIEWDIHDITDHGPTLPAAAILCTGSCGVLTESSAELDPQQLIEPVRSTNPVIGILQCIYTCTESYGHSLQSVDNGDNESLIFSTLQ